MTDVMPVTIAGAGSIGCYAGAMLAGAGRQVTLLARPHLAEAVAARGLDARDLSSAVTHIDPSNLHATADARAALQNAKLILLTVKSGDTGEMAGLIKTHAAPGTPVISLQNGVGNAAKMHEIVGEKHPVLAGMVPFNVVQTLSENAPPIFQRATSGTVLIENSIPKILQTLNVPGFPVALHANMPGVQWSKLVVNLNNAINALAGVPLVEELNNRNWRFILALQQQEALGVLKAAQIKTVSLEGVRPQIMPFALCLPDALFQRVARAMLSIDAKARSSMWDDLEKRRQTEIGELQGAVEHLARRHRVAVPLTHRIIELVKAAEANAAGSPGLKPSDVWPL